jgi:hypothetical protein
MRRNNWRRRKSVWFRIKMWFYHLTLDDVKKGLRFGSEFVSEILLAFAFLIIIFVLPALFH